LWLRQQRSPVLNVPSAIVPESANLLLNPRHPRAGQAVVASKRGFRFDSRLWAAS
jgi:RES domain-containing protein